MVRNLKGIVVKGAQVAEARYGYPTANIKLKKPHKDILPGIYAGLAAFDDKEGMPCVICFGAGYNGKIPKCEVHILDFSGDLYGKKLSVSIDKLISGLLPFRGPREMKQKIDNDIELARKIFNWA